jgi:hypothetical protein
MVANCTVHDFYNKSKTHYYLTYFNFSYYSIHPTIHLYISSAVNISFKFFGAIDKKIN